LPSELFGNAGVVTIEIAQLLKPDLIVLEVAIPGLNGIEAAPKSRKILPKTPIILFASAVLKAQM